jgi:hypothetical protein
VKRLTEFLAEIGAAGVADDVRFEGLARRTGLRHTPDGSYYLSNLGRGHLLYALVRLLRPTQILEIGTGRGYGALSMAQAAEDLSLPTRIVTIDMIPPDTHQPWAIDRGEGPSVASLSINEVWRELPEALTRRITLRTGISTGVIADLLREPLTFDFAFIDGSHDYWTARHDVVGAVMLGRGAPVSLLLDDYGGVQGQDVRRLVDQRLARQVVAGALHRIEMPQTPAELVDNGEHGMVFLDGRGAALTMAGLGWRPAGPHMALARAAAELEGGVSGLRRRVARWRGRA